ncbi:hypothetical protein PSEUDO8BK_30778 [Pseudomonas sp. 8BK]|nr:hypothetical protein PSEUDO8BK_30778 [Pseudomonas sp. 8BK]
MGSLRLSDCRVGLAVTQNASRVGTPANNGSGYTSQHNDCPVISGGQYMKTVIVVFTV